MTGQPLLDVQGLTKHFHLSDGRIVHAVENVDLAIPRGRIVGLVGESGSGKTTVGRALLRLIEPTAGRMMFDGTDVFALSDKEMRGWRRRLQIIFQDPYSSLDPRMTIRAIIDEALDTRGMPRGRARLDRIAELLDLVGLTA
jgi:peptide/nickel transport system ATP-binding protein